MKKNKIFLGGYIDYLNAQNINCKSIATHLDKNIFEVYTMRLSNNNYELIPGVSIFNCFKPYQISIIIAMILGLIRFLNAKFKHLLLREIPLLELAQEAQALMWSMPLNLQII